MAQKKTVQFMNLPIEANMGPVFRGTLSLPRLRSYPSTIELNNPNGGWQVAAHIQMKIISYFFRAQAMDSETLIGLFDWPFFILLFGVAP